MSEQPEAEAPAAPGAQAPRPLAWWMPALIAACGALAYSSSFAGVFLFDDLPHIVVNQNIRQLWPVGAVIGQSLRPVVFYSFAVNYAISGASPWSYHLVNLMVHVVAALALFGVVRRTCRFPAARRVRHDADALALAVALLWVVHPLNTQAVTYVVQRSESMAGMFYLLALYCFVRALQAERSAGWYAGALAALMLALGCKEIAVTAPVMFLLYDRCFAAGSLGGALRRRWALYGAFVAGPPAVLLARRLGGLPNAFIYAGVWGGLTSQRVIPLGGDDFAFGPLAPGAVSSSQYLATQAQVVLHYLRLALWPRPLVFDYAWQPVQSVAQAAPALALIGLLLLAVAWALWRAPALGFVVGSFFLTLAVSSSVLPLPDPAVEHRMYLALAPVLALAVLAARWCWRRAPAAVRGIELAPAMCLALPVALLGSVTFARNFDYSSEARMWADVVRKRPGNARAHYNLGTVAAQEGQLAAAEALFEQAIRIDPTYVSPRVNLGMALYVQGEVPAAQAQYEAALALQPLEPSARNNLGTVLAAQERWREAEQQFRLAIDEIYRYSESEFLRMPLLAHAYTNLAVVSLQTGELADALGNSARALENDPDFVPAYNVRGRVLLLRGEREEALRAYDRALALDPTNAVVRNGRGDALLALGRIDEAQRAYRSAINLAPRRGEYHDDLGRALEAAGDTVGAEAAYREAITLAPGSPEGYNDLGRLLAARGAADEAIAAFRRATIVAPGFAEAYDNIGTTLADRGRLNEAIDAYLRALFVDPEFARAHNNLAVALWKTGRVEEAISHFREALRLQPDYPQAAENLQRVLRQR